MQALIKTLFDIVLIRKGPDAIPPSWLLLHATVLLWFLPLIAATVLLQSYDGYMAFIDVASLVLGLAAYSVVISAAGRRARLLQSMTAIVGCGALVSLLQLTGIVILSPFVGMTLVQIVAWLVFFWGVYVEGHIVARTLDRERLIGVTIAIGVTVFQYLFALTIASSN